jgi:hypothetical protein
MSGETTYLLFDLPLTGKIPGFKEGDGFGLFPFWGQFRALDFALANTLDDLTPHANGMYSYVLSSRDYHASLIEHGESRNASFSVLDDDLDLKGFVSFLKGLESRRILCYSLASVILVDPGSLEHLVSRCGRDEIHKYTVEGTPQDIFCCDRKRLISLIERTYSTGYSGFSPESMFRDVLDIYFTSMEELEAVGIFQNSLQQVYLGNILLKRIGALGIPRFFEEIEAPSRDSSIGSKGKVVDSLLAPRVKVDGTVRNSIIFAGVQVRSGAEIVNSVVLPGNHIGRGARLETTLLFPNFADTAGQPNIGEEAVLGGSSRAVNRAHPDHIYDGLTVVGFNGDIPSKYVVEPAAFIDSYTPRRAIKSYGTVKRGTAVEEELVRR